MKERERGNEEEEDGQRSDGAERRHEDKRRCSRERGKETKSDKKEIWQREEAQCIS